MINNRQKLSKKYKTKMIGRRHSAGETLEDLAKDYELTVTTAGRYWRQYCKWVPAQ